jgi:hypothetical protein
MTIGCFAGAGEGTLLLDEQAIPTADGQELGLAVVTALGCAMARSPRFWVVGTGVPGSDVAISLGLN